MCGGSKKAAAPKAPATVVTNNYDEYQANQRQVAASQSNETPLSSFGSDLGTSTSTPTGG